MYQKVRIQKTSRQEMNMHMDEKLLFRILRRMWYEQHYKGRQPAIAMRKYFSNKKLRMIQNTQPGDWARFKREALEWLANKRVKMN